MTKKMFVLQAIVFLLVCVALPFMLLLDGCASRQVIDPVAYAYGAGKLPND